jgi:hypothetical protein
LKVCVQHLHCGTRLEGLIDPLVEIHPATRVMNTMRSGVHFAKERRLGWRHEMQLDV